MRVKKFFPQKFSSLARIFRKVGDYFYIYIFLPVRDFIAAHRLGTQKLFGRALFFLFAASCIVAFLWIGFNSAEIKNPQILLSEVASVDSVNQDLLDTVVSEVELDVGESIEDNLTNRKFEPVISKDDANLTEGDSISEIFAGQGGYDLSASIENYSLLAASPPNPKVWLKQIQDAGVYSELTYMSYRIREGDMVGIIAERFGLSQDTLISVNNIRKTRLIQIDEYLRIPSMSGVLYTTKTNDETPFSIAEKYQVSAKKTASVNDFEEDTLLEVGVTVFVPDAFLDWVTRQEINGDLFLRPLRSRYYISSNYGWRNSPFTGARSFHTGIDMAAPKWTPIYGALTGRVTTAKKNDRVYGNYVVVTHHSGYSTLYGHMEDLNVSVGQIVSTNSVLGWVGSTGMSTGNHVHFSVFKYGKSVSPVSLWH